MEGKHRLQGTDVPERQVGPGRPWPGVCMAAPAFSSFLLHLRGEIPPADQHAESYARIQLWLGARELPGKTAFSNYPWASMERRFRK